MKNNKGQVLILFVLLLPIILLSALITIEFGNIYIEKAKTKNIIKNTISNGLKNELTQDAINSIIDLNIKDIKDKSIYKSENEIEIKVIQQKEIFNRNIELKYNYKGIKQEEKITISEG